MILAQVYLLICTLFLAGKDASSYLLKDKSLNGDLVMQRIRRWHRDGVVLNILYILPLLFLVNPWLIPIYAILIRLAFYDFAFNNWALLDLRYIGSTAKVDQFFVKIFGQYGAIRKSIVFLAVLILLNILLK